MVLDPGQTGLGRAKGMTTGPRARTLEDHLCSSKTRQLHASPGPLGARLVTSTHRTVLLLFPLMNGLLEPVLHRFSSCCLHSRFHLAQAGCRIQFAGACYGHVHERLLPVFWCFIFQEQALSPFSIPRPRLLVEPWLQLKTRLNQEA